MKIECVCNDQMLNLHCVRFTSSFGTFAMIYAVKKCGERY